MRTIMTKVERFVDDEGIERTIEYYDQEPGILDKAGSTVKGFFTKNEDEKTEVVETEEKPKKKMTKRGKIAIGAGIAALIAVGAALTHHSKDSSDGDDEDYSDYSDENDYTDDVVDEDEVDDSYSEDSIENSESTNN